MPGRTESCEAPLETSSGAPARSAAPSARNSPSAFSLLVTLIFIAGCATAPNSPPILQPPDTTPSVWAVDFVRTLPGAQADYIQSIETNWANARRLARERGAVASYRALVAPKDSAREWDVMLMTEYADSLAWAGREEIFRAIFASPEFVAVEPARPSAEMRVLASNVAMRAFVSEP